VEGGRDGGRDIRRERGGKGRGFQRMRYCRLVYGKINRREGGKKGGYAVIRLK